MTEMKKTCIECNQTAQPLISNGIGMQLTGRPPWAYNDAKKAASSIDADKKTGIGKDTTVTDKREGSPTYGKKIKLNKNMGGYNAQW